MGNNKSVLEMGPMEIMALQEAQLARVRMAAMQQNLA